MTMVIKKYKQIKKIREGNMDKLQEFQEKYKYLATKKQINTPFKLMEFLFFTAKIESFEKEIENFERIISK